MLENYGKQCSTRKVTRQPVPLRKVGRYRLGPFPTCWMKSISSTRECHYTFEESNDADGNQCHQWFREDRSAVEDKMLIDLMARRPQEMSDARTALEQLQIAQHYGLEPSA